MPNTQINNQIIKHNFNTGLEITGQLELWQKLLKSYLSVRDSLRKYLVNIFNNNNVQIILTGAGTSAFIGDVLLGAFNKSFNIHISAVATTDLITHPELYFNKTKKSIDGTSINTIAVATGSLHGLFSAAH